MKRNAFFQLIHKEDGVYLKSYPPVDGGSALKAEDVLQYLDRKRIQDVTVDDITKFVEKASQEKNAEHKILSDDILPENEYPIVTIDRSRKVAKVRLYPPSSKGSRLSLEDLEDLIEQQGVSHGLIENNLKLMLKARLYCMDVLIAKATLPVQGTDAEITYHFNVDKTCKPEMAEDGSVDFHKLDMIENVSEGQLLATLKPAVFGTPGTDVTGAPIKPRKIANLVLKHGKNIHLSDNKLEMYSDVSGNVTLVDGTVFVSNLYEVPADVGPSTGDIEYDGSILVRGNVLTGYTLKASGDIIVNGVVEGSSLISEGKIVLKRGVQGMGKASMEAAGDVISNFIESATVKAGGKIITDAIMHSTIGAEDVIQVRGKRGLIAGGYVRTKSKIEAKTVGSTMGTATELEVGIDPAIGERYRVLEKEMEGLSSEKEALMQNLKILKKRLDTKGKLDDDKMKSLQDTKVKLDNIDQQMEADQKEYEELGEELAKQGDGKIVVTNIAYPGVKLTISSVTTSIHTETHHSAFVREGADIRIRGI